MLKRRDTNLKTYNAAGNDIHRYTRSKVTEFIIYETMIKAGYECPVMVGWDLIRGYTREMLIANKLSIYCLKDKPGTTSGIRSRMWYWIT